MALLRADWRWRRDSGSPVTRVDPAAVEAEFPFHLGGELIFMGGEGLDGFQGFRGEEGLPRFGADKA